MREPRPGDICFCENSAEIPKWKGTGGRKGGKEKKKNAVFNFSMPAGKLENNVFTQHSY